MPAVIEMKGIGKSFPGIRANDDINFTLEQEKYMYCWRERRQVNSYEHTLWAVPTDEGQIYIKGKPVRIINPNTAISHGIGMVHQHFMLVGLFTVTENIILGS